MHEITKHVIEIKNRANQIERHGAKAIERKRIERHRAKAIEPNDSKLKSMKLQCMKSQSM